MISIRIFATRARLLIFLAIFAGRASIGHADTFTWSGGSPTIFPISNNWSNPLNWQGNQVPVNDGTADVVMPNTPRDSPNVDQAWSINSLTFEGGGAYTLDGDPLTIDDVTHNGAGTATFNNAVAVTGSDAVWRANNGPMTFNGQISGSTALVLRAPETITFDGATANTLSGSVTVAEGTLALSKSGTNGAIAGNLTISPAAGVAGATVRWEAANQVGEAPSSQVNLRGSGLVDLNGFSETLSQLVLFDNGRVQSTGGTLTIDGQLILGGNDSEVQLGAGELKLTAAVFRGIAASGTMRIGAQVVTLGQLQNLFIVNNSPGLVELEINASIAGTAPTHFLEKGDAGALRLTGASTYQGGTVITGGTLIVDNTTGSGTGTGTVTVQTATRLAGDGSTTSLVQMQSGATIGPSGATGFPIGSLNVGSLSMNTASAFEVEFNHALPVALRRDLLTVAGTASIIGNLVLKNLNAGGTPSPSETYTILAAATITGSFANVANGQRLTTSDGSGSFVVNYGASSAFTPNQVVLSAFQAILAADFDLDGDVDSDDLAQWRGDFGLNDLSDADNDGDSDGADFLVWQRQLGSGPAVAAAAGAVPEPSGSILTFCMLSGLWLNCRAVGKNSAMDHAADRRQCARRRAGRADSASLHADKSIDRHRRDGACRSPSKGIYEMSLRRSIQTWVCVLAWAGAGGLPLRVAPAATLVWDGTGTNWNVLSSWSLVSNSTTPDPPAKPGANDTAVFNIETVNSSQAPLMAGPQSVRGLVFSSLGHVRLVGSLGGLTPTELTVGVGGISSSGANIHATAEDVVINLAAPQTWTSNGVLGDVRTIINGPVNMGTNRLTIDGGSETTLFGQLSGTGGLTKQGSGPLSLSSGNSFNGDLSILAGTVGLFDNGALNATTPNAVAFGTSGTLGLYGRSVTVSGLTSASGPTSAIVENGSSTNVATLTVAISVTTPTNAFAGVISDNGAPLNLKKTGAGALTLDGNNTYTGATTIEQGMLTVNGSLARGVLVKSGATLAGAGTIGQNVTLEGGGTLAPGNPAGEMTLRALTMLNGATLALEIGGVLAGDQYDRIETESLAFNGTLRVSLIGGFAPSAGQSFDVLDWNVRLGTFDGLDLPVLGPGLAWNTSQLYTAGVLSVASTTLLAADFDEDGDVDATDLSIWRGAFDLNQLGDADGDSDSDGNDFLQWQRQLGSGLPNVAASAAVPEPETCLLLVVGLLLAPSLRSAASSTSR